MKRFPKSLIVLSTFSLSFNVLADNAGGINPDDLQDVTKINPQAAVFLTSDADVRVSGMFSGQWSPTTQFAGFVEGVVGNADKENKLGVDYLGGRGQYFQVHQFENDVVPRAGFSLDLVHQKNTGLDDTLLLSAGAVAKIDDRFTPGFQLFPNIAYTVGDVFGESADGYLANLFMTTPLGDNGAFVLAWPEYFNVSGDVVELESKSLNVVLHAPMKTNYSQWLVSKFEYNKSDITLPNGASLDKPAELKAEIGIKWYF
ncbi:hypothetical protein NF212_21100 [Parasalinivibrio latis]|uniref:hypothetical protein n=1 Tax=Parasalinivibrio latis TaxID=2952610 RepID=UPI0030E00F27